MKIFTQTAKITANSTAQHGKYQPVGELSEGFSVDCKKIFDIIVNEFETSTYNRQKIKILNKI